MTIRNTRNSPITGCRKNLENKRDVPMHQLYTIDTKRYTTNIIIEKTSCPPSNFPAAQTRKKRL